MEYAIHLLIMFGIFGTLASAANIDAGYAGSVSFAYAAVFGASAYAGAWTLGQGSSLAIAFLVALAVGAFANLVVAILAGRMAAGDFAVATLALQGLFATVAANTALVGGAMGLQVPTAAGAGSYVSSAMLASSALVLAVVLSSMISRSSFGLALRTVREDVLLARSVGIDDRRLRAVTMTLSGVLIGAAGFVFIYYLQLAHPESFTTGEAILILSMAIAGGLGSVWGPVAGAALLILLPESLRWLGLPSALQGPAREIIYGVMLTALVLSRPLGLFGAFVPGVRPNDVSVR